MTVLLVGVAVYVASIVTANTFATVVAGRTRRIALLRLIGASARSQRAEIARQGLVVGVIGAFLGLVGGHGARRRRRVAGGTDAGARRHRRSPWCAPELLIPAVDRRAHHVGGRMGRIAPRADGDAAAGARRVGRGVPRRRRAPHRAQRRGARALHRRRGAARAAAILAGLVTPLGVVVAFVGGILSFTGLALGATLVMPPVLRLVGRLFGRSATARLAAENALRYPERSSRMAIGVVMGVTLVTMFAVAIESMKAVMTAAAGGELPREIGDAPRLVRGDHDGARRRLGGDRRASAWSTC